MQGSDYYKSRGGTYFWRDRRECDWDRVCEGTFEVAGKVVFLDLSDGYECMP